MANDSPVPSDEERESIRDTILDEMSRIDSILSEANSTRDPISVYAAASTIREQDRRESIVERLDRMMIEIEAEYDITAIASVNQARRTWTISFTNEDRRQDIEMTDEFLTDISHDSLVAYIEARLSPEMRGIEEETSDPYNPLTSVIAGGRLYDAHGGLVGYIESCELSFVADSTTSASIRLHLPAVNATPQVAGDTQGQIEFPIQGMDTDTDIEFPLSQVIEEKEPEPVFEEFSISEFFESSD